MTSIPAATLRAWERRYGIGLAQRTDSGYRLYDEAALAEVRAMQQLLGSGWAAKQAANEIVRRRGHQLVMETVPSLPQFSAFVDAARRLDDLAMGAILDEVFSKASFEHVFDSWLTPALHELGEAWADGTLDISAEHFASAAVMRRLSAAYEAAAVHARGPRVLVGLPAGAVHEIGALAFAIALRRVGLNATYLGADLPTDSWMMAAGGAGVRAIVLSLSTATDVPAGQAVVTALHELHPALCLAVGGTHADELTDSSIQFTGSVPESARQLAAHLADSTRS